MYAGPEPPLDCWLIKREVPGRGIDRERRDEAAGFPVVLVDLADRVDAAAADDRKVGLVILAATPSTRIAPLAGSRLAR